MATTSTIPAFKTALVAALQTALGSVQVGYRWPGPTTEAEGVYLGGVRARSEIASIKAGRQHRNESYEVQLVCQTFRTADDPSGAEAAEARAFELFEEVQNVLAVNPQQLEGLGVSGWGDVTEYEAPAPAPFEHGWHASVIALIEAHARLT